MFGIPVGELAILAAAIAGGGVLTGLLAGLFGIGGGGVIVPVLYEVFRALGVLEDVRVQLCIGTSLPSSLRTTFTLLLSPRRAEGIGLHEVVPPMDGCRRSRASPPAPRSPRSRRPPCSVAFLDHRGHDRREAAVPAADSWRIADDLPRGPRMLLFGYLIGLSSSLMGVSGGSMSNIIMTLYGKTIHAAVATSAGLGVPIAVAGTLGFMLAGLPHQSLMPPLCIGYVSILGFVVMAPISSYMAGFGAKLAHKTPRRWLEIMLGLFLATMAARFIVSLA